MIFSLHAGLEQQLLSPQSVRPSGDVYFDYFVRVVVMMTMKIIRMMVVLHYTQYAFKTRAAIQLCRHSNGCSGEKSITYPPNVPRKNLSNHFGFIIRIDKDKMGYR